MDKPRCRKCLLENMGDQQALLKSIEELIEALPEEKRTPEKERQRRLRLCQECDALNSGTCGLCGCFVELRAAKNWLHCPNVPPCW